VAVGVAGMMSLSGTVGTIAAAVVLRRRLGGIGARAVLGRTAWFLGAALVAGGAGVGLVVLLGAFTADGFAVSGRIPAIITLALVGGAMALVYAAILALTRNPEFLALARPVLRRVTRRS